MKSAEMKRKEPQKKHAEPYSATDGSGSVFLLEILMPDRMKPDVSASTDSGQDCEVSQYQAAKPQTPDQVPRLPPQEIGNSQSHPERKKVGKDSPGQTLFMPCEDAANVCELLHAFLTPPVDCRPSKWRQITKLCRLLRLLVMECHDALFFLCGSLRLSPFCQTCGPWRAFQPGLLMRIHSHASIFGNYPICAYPAARLQ